MKSALLNEYLAKKGFTPEDLFAVQAVIMDEGDFHTAQDNAWLNKPYEVTTPEGEKQTITPMQVLEKKRFRYKEEGCTSAIFVPLFRLSGDFTGFSIRRMHAESKHDSWFMPGSKKVDLLYNLIDAFNYAAEKNSVIVTEGVYDTIALRKHGFKNSVALLGTHMSNIQFFQLMSVVENIALCLDNDEAGKKAIKRIADEHKGSVKFWTVNIDKDPDEFLSEHGPVEFKKRIKPYVQ